MSTKTIVMVALLSAGLTGCASSSLHVVAGEPNWTCDRARIDDEWIESTAAVKLVAAVSDHCQPGAFKLVVRTIGRSDTVLYLNSENDYRTANNLAIAILPQAQHEIEQRLGELDLLSLKDQEILVVGVARRVPIHYWIGSRLRPNAGSAYEYFPPDVDLGSLNLTYYQTHVLVESASQIWLLRPSIGSSEH